MNHATISSRSAADGTTVHGAKLQEDDEQVSQNNRNDMRWRRKHCMVGIRNALLHGNR